MASKDTHGIVEFEFVEAAEGSGKFVACGEVVQSIRRYLARGELDQAASLLATCTSNIGDELIQDVAGGGASKQMIEALSLMFFRAKDFGRAAVCASRAGNTELAARCLEANYDLAQAAEQYMMAGNTAKAAALFERSQQYDRAAKLYLGLSDHARAAENLERAGKLFEAASTWGKVQRWDKAVQLLQKVDEGHEAFARANLALGQILERMGNQQLARERYLLVVRKKPLDRDSVDIHLRLALLLCESKMPAQAKQLVDRVVAFDSQAPGVEQVLSRIAQLLPPVTVGNLPEATAEVAEDIPMDLDLPQPDGKDPAATPRNLDLVGVDRDFDYLRRTPIFAELSLSELRYLQSVCAKASFCAGEILIEEGRPGESLYVIISGTVRVQKRCADGSTLDLRQLGPGAYLGEMSMIDDSPTSATVIATEAVTAFVLQRTRFLDLAAASDRIQLRICRVMMHTLAKRLREAERRFSKGSDGKP